MPKSEKPRRKGVLSPIPGDHPAVIYHFDTEHAPPVEFKEDASPGLLMDWARRQLTALDWLLVPIAIDPSDKAGAEVAVAVRGILGPALDALNLATQRACESAKEPRATPIG